MSLQTVLVIDDDSDIRDLIAETLIDEGYHVLTSGDGQTAVALAAAQPPGLILLDLMMPKMSGWQVIEELKASSRTSSTPVVLVSASRDLQTISRQLGAASCLAKPFDLDTLVKMVHAYLGPPSGSMIRP